MHYTAPSLHRVRSSTTIPRGPTLIRGTRREENPQDGDVSSQDNCLVGLCTGLLAATAITSSRSVSSLIPIAVEIVLVAFRTGLCVTRMAETLENGRDSTDSWTFVVPEVSEEAARVTLEDFHIANVRLNHIGASVVAND